MRLDIAPELLPFEHRFVALDGARIHGFSSAPPGYGYTPREHSAFLERFVDALELRDLTLMVQDWGGPIGRALTRRFNLVPRFFFWRGFAQPLERRVLDACLAPWRDPARRLLPATIGPHQLIAASDYLAEVEANLPKLADRPALIVWGAKDFAFDDSHRARFEAAFPNHRTIVYPDASHFLQEDVGDRIAEAFKAFRGPATLDPP